MRIIPPGKPENEPAGFSVDRFSMPSGTATVLCVCVCVSVPLHLFVLASLPILPCLSDNLLLCLLFTAVACKCAVTESLRKHTQKTPSTVAFVTHTHAHVRARTHTDEWQQLDGETKHVRTEES